MILSPARRRTHRQRLLFDRRSLTAVDSFGYARFVIGRLCESLTRQLLRGRLHADVAGYDYCPDLSWLGAICEVKASGANGDLFVYTGRLERDRRLAESRPLFYVVWRHRHRVVLGDSVRALVRGVLGRMETTAVVPFEEIAARCVREVPLNSKYGTKNTNSDYGEGYGSGYKIRVSQIKQFTTHRWRPAECPKAQRLLFPSAWNPTDRPS